MHTGGVSKKYVQKEVSTGKRSLASLPKSRTACKRCRTKKIKCDHELPSCRNCAKIGEPCVSIDPATGEDVPRSYILFLEDRIAAMSQKLEECGVDLSTIPYSIPTHSKDVLPNKPKHLKNSSSDDSDKYDPNMSLGNFLIRRGKAMKGEKSYYGDHDDSHNNGNDLSGMNTTNSFGTTDNDFPETGSAVKYERQPFEFQESNKNISQVGTVKGDTSKSFLGDSSGISFAKLVFTAANFSPDKTDNYDFDEDINKRESKIKQYNVAESTIDFDPLELPTREEAEQLIIRYFVDTNSQLPIFHREYFLKKYYEPIYGRWNKNISLTSDNTDINTDFKLPKGTYFTPDRSDDKRYKLTKPWFDTLEEMKKKKPKKKKINLPARFEIPLFFLNMVFSIGHATQVLKSDILKLVTFKRRALQYSNTLFATRERLEALSGTLLMAIYSLMRPNIPGVWYIMGSVLRLTVDLGLHSEKLNSNCDAFQKELRRRLFWCAYSLDRQVCSYFGRPFGIPEESITTRFPSMLDDSKIFPDCGDIEDFSDIVNTTSSSKIIATSMYKIRKIQASIVKVLYAPHAELPREFSTLESWRLDTLEKLDNWYYSEVPKSFELMNCQFNTFFFDLNYHYSKSVLYGLSPKCPALNERAFQIVFESTKGTIDVFDGLRLKKKMSYTWVAVHNMFMTGMTYLYVIYYYSGDSIIERESTVRTYTNKVLNVLKDLIGTCEAAKNCFKTYHTLCAAVIKLRYSKTEGHDRYNDATDIYNKNDHEEAGFNMSYENNQGDYFEFPLEQFFNELGKSDGMTDMINNGKPNSGSMNSNTKLMGSNTFEDDQFVNYNSNNDGMINNSSNNNNNNNNNNSKSASVNTSNHPNMAHDNKDISDLLYQVTSQSIWEELFVNGNGTSNYENPAMFPGVAGASTLQPQQFSTQMQSQPRTQQQAAHMQNHADQPAPTSHNFGMF